MTARRRALADLALVGALVGALISLSACGGDDGSQTATDTSPTTAQADPSPSTPTEAPKPGSLPDFAATDYAYTLEMRCYCANMDQKYRITVADGTVSAVTWATAGDGHAVGDPVSDEFAQVTIQDLIDKGNDPEAAQVDVEWPAGQAYPDSIYVDQDKLVADEETTWVVSDVETA
jgi:hypothetical protein